MTRNQNSTIAFSNVSVVREERRILDGICLELGEDRVGIIGPNGSGKSTLVRLINALITPTEGAVYVHGLNTAAQPKRVRRKVGFVFQNPENQIIMPIVQDDVAFGLRNLGHAKHHASVRARESLARMGIEKLAERESHTLSAGEKQMAALAGVLAMDPEVIIFDEPTTMLDLKNRNRLLAEIMSLRQQAIVITHDLSMLEGFDRVLVVSDGTIAYDGLPRDAVNVYVETCEV